MTEEKNSKWCIVANVVSEHPFGHGGTVTKRGTKHFKPGAKVYIFGLFAGMCESVAVVGRHRGSNQYATMVVLAEHLTNFRPKVAYSPEVLRRFETFDEPGWCPIKGADDAKRWCKDLPQWRRRKPNPNQEIEG